MQQGILGDCYILAALSALADTHKDLVERLVVSSPASLRAGVSVVCLMGCELLKNDQHGFKSANYQVTKVQKSARKVLVCRYGSKLGALLRICC